MARREEPVSSVQNESMELRYTPGACNIGRAEIVRRRVFGIVALGLALGLLLVLLVIGAPPLARWLVLPFLWGGFVSLEQARRRFCVAFAYGGVRSRDDGRERVDVGTANDRARDRRAARRMVLECGVAAAIVTFVLTLLPL